MDLPLDDDIYEHVNCESSSYKEYDVRPGDVLYLPRGFIHEARAKDSLSVHLTLSISVIRWASLLKHLVHVLAKDNVGLRKSVPIEVLRSGRIDLAEAVVRSLAVRLDDRAHLATTISQLQDRLLSVKTRLPTCTDIYAPDPPPELCLESMVEIAADQVYVLSESENGLVLKFIGASIDIAEDLKEAIEFLCDRRSFLVRELPALTSAEKLALVGRLLECEFLTLRA